MSQRFFSIGDIHGHFPRLDKLLLLLRDEAKLDLNEDVLVFTGDYTDRNEYSKQVIQTIKELKEKYEDNVIVLMGNHEDFLLDYLHVSPIVRFNDGDRWCFEVNGGRQTFYSYIPDGNFNGWNAPQDLLIAMKECGHYEFIKDLPLFYETDEYWFSHAPIPKPEHNHDVLSQIINGLAREGVNTSREKLINVYMENPDKYMSLVKGHKDILIWSYSQYVDEYEFAYNHGKLAICGHATAMGKTRIYNHIIYNDSGAAYEKGRLSAVELKDGAHVKTWWVS